MGFLFCSHKTNMPKLKIQFHMHTKQDPVDNIAHTEHEVIDRAAELGYNVLAITCHNVVIFSDELKEYAAKKRILLIPAIEKSIHPTSVNFNHVLIINADLKAQKIKSFDDLREYRKSKPDILVIAAHPYYPAKIALKENLEKHIDLFDAIEYSWYHSEKINKYNEKAVQVAEKHKLPMLATSDNHLLKYFDNGYSIIDAEKQDIPSVFKAIKENKIKIVSHNLTFWQLISSYSEMTIRMLIKALYCR